MPRFLTNRSVKLGTAPGSLMHVGRKFIGDSQYSGLQYDEEQTRHLEGPAREANPAGLVSETMVSWVDFIGLHDVELAN